MRDDKCSNPECGYLVEACDLRAKLELRTLAIRDVAEARDRWHLRAVTAEEELAASKEIVAFVQRALETHKSAAPTALAAIQQRISEITAIEHDEDDEFGASCKCGWMATGNISELSALIAKHRREHRGASFTR